MVFRSLYRPGPDAAGVTTATDDECLRVDDTLSLSELVDRRIGAGLTYALELSSLLEESICYHVHDS